ncbi:single-stranded DNA-binding protein [Faecalibacterium phage FP_Taranis]|uniref:Single-stranded DNA-binding protein n=1 Tax=Faecalibacterium phage FP_Taranis TaxID=2070186 RepID=A0A2K9V463_9CAUD|nr:single strand DNA binding protein [Faecalibacterium phage FP_Taranis]AUV56817.1 single-stranded DNA-binding protein [Faecalibacterium phage FP_Taranis]PDX67291.1 single-stranded DNA-binding protein [Faecalibacterium prausnitzii]PDX77751.1 single-stranded DNA-binding protein [Faecalibacterium prausnitzii]
MLNNCIFQGRFAADPEMRTTQSGLTVASFRMAVDRDNVGQDGRRATDWLNFVAWRKTAEFVCQYFRKGSTALVECQCQTRSYEDKNGQKRTATEFVVQKIHFCGPKTEQRVDDGGTNPPPATYRNQQPQPQQMGFATQSQRQQWQGAADHPGNVQVSQSFSQGSDDDFSVLDDADDLPF